MARTSRSLVVSRDEFDALVRQALAQLPPHYAKMAEDVSVVVEEEPSADILRDLELESEDDLLGLYQGQSLDESSFFQPGGQLPARISLYRGPILRVCRTKTDVVQEICDTVVHELGHHVGLDDEDMPY